MAVCRNTFSGVTKGINVILSDIKCAPTSQVLHGRSFSTSNRKYEKKSYKLVVAGGGCGGLATASMFSKALGKGNVAVIEPKEVIFLFTRSYSCDFPVVLAIRVLACTWTRTSRTYNP